MQIIIRESADAVQDGRWGPVSKNPVSNTPDYSSMEFLFRCNPSQAQKSNIPEKMASIANLFL